MPNTCCCVPLCSERGGHSFPTDQSLRKKWLVAIRRDKWTPKKSSVVCKKHFQATDYNERTYYGSRPLQSHLKKGSVPSIFAWTATPTDAALNRASRLQKRLGSNEHTDCEVILEHEQDVQHEVIIDFSTEEEFLLDQDTCNEIEPAHSNAYTQTFTNTSQLCVTRFIFDSTAIHYYTGLESYAKFSMVLATLGDAVNHLIYRDNQCQVLSIENQFFLTLIKLRRYTPDYELSLNFGISETVVSNIFLTWINFLYCQWRELQIWPSRELTSFYMPTDFRKKFPSTRVILDGVEIPIKKPSAKLAQQITFSNYKNRNTLKMVVGSSPGGLLTSIPLAYGGSASDRSLVQSGDLLKICEDQDSIMADKGFDMQDIFAGKNIKVNVPTFMKGINQLPGLKLLNDRKISSKRIHIERLIGLCKTFRILQSPLPSSHTQLGSQILFICFMLCNFKKCIVDKDA